MNIAGYQFSGPWVLPTTLCDRPGVYVVLCEAVTGHRVLEVGESADVLETLCEHDPRGCSSIYCSGSLRYAAHYCDESSCPQIVRDVSQLLKAPCGRVRELVKQTA